MESRSKKTFRLIALFLNIIIIVLIGLVYNANSKNEKIKRNITKLSSKIEKKYNSDEIEKEIELYKNIDDSIKNKYDEYFTNISKLEEKIVKGESDVKIAYLTFDDGPYDLTYQVLDTLKANDVKATFFVLGKTEVEDRYKRIVDEGHTLANHTFDHNIGTGLYRSVDSFIAEVKQLEDYLYDITGYRTTLVRFPGGSPTAGSLKDGIVNRLHEMGYKYVDWTSETGDGSSQKLAIKDTWQWYIDTTSGVDIVVLLMHDYNYSTVGNLQRIIDDLKGKGYLLLPLHNKSIMAN